MTTEKIDYVDLKLAVDFGDMPTNDVHRAAQDIREALAMFGRHHIKVLYHSKSHQYDVATKSRTVEVTSKMLGTTPIGEAIVAAIGSTWNA